MIVENTLAYYTTKTITPARCFIILANSPFHKYQACQVKHSCLFRATKKKKVFLTFSISNCCHRQMSSETSDSPTRRFTSSPEVRVTQHFSASTGSTSSSTADSAGRPASGTSVATWSQRHETFFIRC
jgi:hypothetical protein